MEDEDEHSLESIEYGEEVRHDYRGLVDEEKAEGPSKTEQTKQSKCTHDPGSKGQNRHTNTQTHTHTSRHTHAHKHTHMRRGQNPALEAFQ